MGAAARPAVPALLAALEDKRLQTRLEVAAALAGTGEHLADAREAEIAGLSGSDNRDRARAAGLIGDLGADGAPALDDLAKALNDRSDYVRSRAAFAIGRIAVALQQAGRTDAIAALKDVQAAIARSDDPSVSTSGPNVKAAITALEKQRQQDPRYILTWPLREQPVATGIVLGYLGLALGWLVLLWAAPLAVLRVAETLDKLPRPHMPGWLGGVEVSVPSLLLVGFLRHRDRVLDAWMPHTTGDDTPLEKVTLDGDAVPVLGPESLRPLFSAPRACLLVVGDPEWTARVASAIAIWAMARDKPRRLLPHAMLPVWLDEDLPPADGGGDPLVMAVHDHLPAVRGTPSEALVIALLRRRRVLVEVMNLSERGEATRAALRPRRPDFAVNALVVTSSSDEALGGARRSILRAAA
jgi:hypothetical protein